MIICEDDMWELYIYAALLLVMFAIVFFMLFISKMLPVKVRVSAVLLAILFTLRYAALFIMLLSNNIEYLYMLKPFYFLNLVIAPIAAFVLLYIFTRMDRMNFSYIFLISGMLFALYYAVMVISPAHIYPLLKHGFTMQLGATQAIPWIYLVFYTALMFLGIIIIQDKKNINRKGMMIFIIAASVSSAEIVLQMISIKPFTEYVFGDLMWALSLYYSFLSIKK
jgi:hypothetical protein